ncbi:MAG: hypothetical protein KF678_11760 [Phycisphaeraceae bacterium]|nr:hypothetical protein [Phycisphaeraceae bacterium]
MTNRVVRLLCACAGVAAAGPALAEPLTDPGQLSAGNVLITFEGRPTGPLGPVATIQCVTFSSPQGMSIVDLSSQAYTGPLVGGRGLHPLPGPIGSGLYINTSIVFSRPVSEVGLGWWDPTSTGNVLRVYNSNNELLEEVFVPPQPPGGGGASFVGIRRQTAEIALAICFPGAASDTYVIDNISFGPACYVNCDCSTGNPTLTANDFQCFLNAYASGDAYANCDGSTGNPLLTANDFQCFLNKYAVGCP